MATCSLCNVSLKSTAERRKVYSSASEPVLPLLRQAVSEMYGRDALREVFLPDSKLCRPCHRRLERTTKSKKEIQEHLEELTQQVRRLGEANGVQRETEALPTPPKRQASSSETEDSPASKRRAIAFQKSTPVRRTMQRMQPRQIRSKKPSPAVAVRVFFMYIHVHVYAYSSVGQGLTL